MMVFSYTHIGGYSGSSTRTEVAAGIIALSCHGPVHIGSDSRVFVDKANLLLDQLGTGRQVTRIWHMVSDGDLWSHFEAAVKAKGPNSIRISWVKGHADQAHIEAGLTTTAHKVGNDRADLVADKGVLVHGEDVVTIARLFTSRHQQYTKLMLDLAKHIIEGHMVHRSLLKNYLQGGSSAHATHAGSHVKYTPLIYPDPQVCNTLLPNSSILSYPKEVTKYAIFIKHRAVPQAAPNRPLCWVR